MVGEWKNIFSSYHLRSSHIRMGPSGTAFNNFYHAFIGNFLPLRKDMVIRKNQVNWILHQFYWRVILRKQNFIRNNFTSLFFFNWIVLSQVIIFPFDQVIDVNDTITTEIFPVDFWKRYFFVFRNLESLVNRNRPRLTKRFRKIASDPFLH